MCQDCAPAHGWSRRRFLAAGAGLAAATTIAWRPAVAIPGRSDQPPINPRVAWAGESRPPGPIDPEPDVRFLVVHHTVNGNDYSAESVPAILRQIHAFHTGPEKGWPDIAYNFVVDRYGGIWETRAGSLEQTVAGDATGGNQGFDQKCAFIGDHRTEPPTDAAAAAMTSLLAWLADRSAIDVRVGAEVTFTSRGSNRHPAGTTVTVPTITGHRSVSQTTCPGDAGMTFVSSRQAAISGGAQAPSTTDGPPSTTQAPTTQPTTSQPGTSQLGTSQPPATQAPSTPVPSSSASTGGAPTTVAGTSPSTTAGELAGSPPAEGADIPALAVVVAGLGIAGVGAVLARRAG